MLKVPCGVSGRVRVVRENSETGEVTGEFEFDNIWTDFGLSAISTYSSQSARWPSYLKWGSGAHPEPHGPVTALASPVGGGSVSYEVWSGEGVVYDTETCSVTRTRSATQPARGVPWEISELGLSYGASGSLLTYALVRNSSGEPEPIDVSAIEIITIYYTVQVVYPMALPPQQVTVEGLPPTTATFELRPDAAAFAFSSIGPGGGGDSYYHFAGYSSPTFGGRVGAELVGSICRWGINSMNRTTPYFGTFRGAANHIWTLDPPITKNNTQILELEVFWEFTNTTPVEV